MPKISTDNTQTTYDCEMPASSGNCGCEFTTNPQTLERDERVYECAEAILPNIDQVPSSKRPPLSETVESIVHHTNEVVNNDPAIIPAADMSHEEAEEIVKNHFASQTLDVETAQVLESVEFNSIERRLNELCEAFDEVMTKGGEANYEKLQQLVFPLMMLLFRRSAQIDQEFVSEMGLKVTTQAMAIKDTYNSWHGIAITIVASSVGLVGGGLSFSQIIPGLAPETVQMLTQSAQPLSGASSAINSIGGIFENQTQAKRGVEQMWFEKFRTKEDAARTSKRTNSETVDSVKRAAEEAIRESMRARREVVA